MQKVFLGLILSAGVMCSVEAGSLPWVAEHLSLQYPSEISVSSISIFSLIAISNQTWTVNLMQQSIHYDSPVEDYVQIEEVWQSNTGVEWQYNAILPESDYFEMESMKGLMGLQYLNMQNLNKL